MGNTTFYKDVSKNPDKITWSHVFSESFKKHGAKDRARKLAVGTGLKEVNESNMLASWEKPWLWVNVGKWGLLMVLAIYFLVFIGMSSFGVGWAQLVMMVCIPPIIIPLIILIFIWELNIPQNISIWDCLIWTVLGGGASFGFTLFVRQYIPADSAPFAAFSEEPGKLIASLVILLLISNKRKIYGITGLVVGACVGGGFAMFESMEYALLKTGLNAEAIVYIQVLRALGALSSHILYSAPFVAGLTYNMKDSKFSAKAFFSPEFIMLFLLGIAQHYAHNSGWASSFGELELLISVVVETVVAWAILLWITRKCLNQAVTVAVNRGGSLSSSGSAGYISDDAGKVILMCEEGICAGKKWDISGKSSISIGRGENNSVVLPASTKGVSREHCVISSINRKWYITDSNSSYGTFLNGTRIMNGMPYEIQPGDKFTLGGVENRFIFIIR